MQVQIQGIQKQLNVQTITLQPEDGENMYAFHCIGCGNFHQKIGGKVSKVYPIYEPSDQVPVVSTCRNCGKQYNFQTHDGYSSDKIKVLLQPIDSINYFYCYNGKDRILEFTGTYIKSFVDNKLHEAPFFSPCTGLECKTVYLFSNIL